MRHSAYRFTHAMTRRPGESIAHGLRAEDGGDPDAARFLTAHDAYVAALRATGAAVTVEPPLEMAQTFRDGRNIKSLGSHEWRLRFRGGRSLLPHLHFLRSETTLRCRVSPGS